MNESEIFDAIISKIKRDPHARSQLAKVLKEEIDDINSVNFVEQTEFEELKEEFEEVKDIQEDLLDTLKYTGERFRNLRE